MTGRLFPDMEPKPQKKSPLRAKNTHVNWTPLGEKTQMRLDIALAKGKIRKAPRQSTAKHITHYLDPHSLAEYVCLKMDGERTWFSVRQTAKSVEPLAATKKSAKV